MTKDIPEPWEREETWPPLRSANWDRAFFSFLFGGTLLVPFTFNCTVNGVGERQGYDGLFSLLLCVFLSILLVLCYPPERFG